MIVFKLSLLHPESLTPDYWDSESIIDDIVGAYEIRDQLMQFQVINIIQEKMMSYLLSSDVANLETASQCRAFP